jgi:hypothetical protein
LHVPVTVDVSPPDACGAIDRHPLLVTAKAVDRVEPREAAVGRLEQIDPELVMVRKIGERRQAVIVEVPVSIAAENRIAAEHLVLEHAREGPGLPAVVAVRPPSLAEVGGHVVELPPADDHTVGIGRIDGNGRLIRGVTLDVLSLGSDVHLDTDERISDDRSSR